MTPNDGTPHNSDLFTVRLWLETVDNGVERRGTVRHLLTGETLHFRDWPALETFFMRILQGETDTPVRKE